ncbi:probable fucosyltransferase 8 [Cucumis sativus]|uniref:Fucosyltransferase n=1 Tax=Cucumis sativus TaxID=3659 RepID=A0A0A0KYT2_CUCSA|nr:probable fucosyltransferase 8 [Cucumis sativus]XP_031739550.1 probable fucosyltransferase 8 [Cucumis sativus]KGN53512.1 hypothetical protein Csa_015058 [Cucumis sativus]
METMATTAKTKMMKLVWLIVGSVMVIVISQRFWMPSLEFSHLWGSVGFTNNNPRNNDKFINGLLPPGFDQKSCLSRYQLNLNRKPSPHKPSFPLLSKLRRYEALHRRCGPNSPSFRQALLRLSSPTNSTTPSDHDCKYIVILTRDGLGNRILAILSAFLYALISNRVILIHPRNTLEDLFCEPFLESSWLLPSDFPLQNKFGSFRQSFPESFGNILRNGMRKKTLEDSRPPPYLYLHLSHDADDYDKLFYCDRQQNLLKKVPWLIMETNNYLVPGIFLVSSFRQELNELFPAKDTVFHHLGRYLFHPTNDVWGLILRSYKPYVARANEMVGIQVRIFGSESGSIQDQMNQILACTQKKKLLPETEPSSPEKTNFSTSQKVKVVLVTSLNSQYSETLKEMYWEHPTVDGEVVAVYQPSHEGVQSSDNRIHNRKALAEMYLLSLSDVLVTSDWSTFGYVAQGLAGVKPWMLYKAEKKVFWALQQWLKYKTRNETGEDWPCREAVSMEPCLQVPPVCDCDEMKRMDGGNVLPYVIHCEDASWGLKLG